MLLGEADVDGDADDAAGDGEDDVEADGLGVGEEEADGEGVGSTAGTAARCHRDSPENQHWCGSGALNSR